MIGIALKLLQDELGSYISLNSPGDDITSDDVILHNIALLDNEEADLNNKIVMTLVNIEEESTLKNCGNTVKGINGTRYVEPPVFLNLYMLISATLGPDLADAYEFALNRLSLIVQFFQSKKTFTVKNSPFATLSGNTVVTEEVKEALRLNVELYTLTFEQINHLWGSLGGKQVPSALYKIRLVKIQENTGQEAPVIERIKTVETLINADCDE
ncbi:DUF4255 domain-containing protein [Pricia sp. S334]|uniref:DUF4255 domain-containing protein n=1 Tax=Pricia mediterranea TaxID=3076079 RepID=A0ABU3L3D8_9FLAO|nr:DUF4255 domain-containing protein [Pricia sp. S334]MDT7828254.1 DUF4255 domain-containing protein [Pricia sp. S334]